MYNVSKKSEHLSIASNQTCKNEEKKHQIYNKRNKIYRKVAQNYSVVLVFDFTFLFISRVLILFFLLCEKGFEIFARKLQK